MVLFDFEAPGLSNQWQMGRGGSAVREACESGWCLHVKPAAGSGIASRSVPTNWTGFGELTFRARAAAATTMEVRVPAGEGRAAWWRRVDLREGGWQDVRIPLGWIRRADGPAPSWSTVRALSFSFRDAIEVWIDDIAVEAGAPVLTPEAIAALTGGDVTRGQHAAVISLVPGIDAVALAGRLDAVADAVLADLPFLAAPSVPVPLLIYPDEAAYSAGVGQIGAAFAANADNHGHDGYTIEGIATSSWDPVQGVGRPVYGHEFVHALLTRTASLPNGGEWLRRGSRAGTRRGSTPRPTSATSSAGSSRARSRCRGYATGSTSTPGSTATPGPSSAPCWRGRDGRASASLGGSDRNRSPGRPDLPGVCLLVHRRYEMPKYRRVVIGWTTVFTDTTTAPGKFNALGGWLMGSETTKLKFTFEARSNTDTGAVFEPGFQTANVENSPDNPAQISGIQTLTGDGMAYPTAVSDISTSTAGKAMVRPGVWMKASGAGLKMARLWMAIDIEES